MGQVARPACAARPGRKLEPYAISWYQYGIWTINPFKVHFILKDND